MITFIRKHWKWIAIFAISFLMFYPALFCFFTNDDFFFLKIAKVSSFKDFLNFFNLVTDIGGIGVYRPLTLRVFYFLTVEFFHTNPMPLHVISFATFFLDIFLVGTFTRLMTKNNKIVLLSSFLYATSVTHFGQLYYIGAFQELFLTMLFLGSVILFIKYETGMKGKHPLGKLIMSLFLFILSIMSKETAVVLPFALVLVHVYLKLTKRIKVSVNTLILSLLPYFVILGVYLFMHFNYFGLISGDSYIWNFAPGKAINSLAWYGLWSLNIPEMLVDFVGPGLHFNPNLLKYWANKIIPIFALFVLQILMIFYSFLKFIKSGKDVNKKGWLLMGFSLLWFMGTLIPVIFLPVHKFTYYLTLPLVGVVLALGYLLEETKIGRVAIGIFLVMWTITSIISLRLTYQTNWITQSQVVTYKVFQYFKKNGVNLSGGNVYFIDTKSDSSLPWSPTQTLKTVLSDKNFFDVFYPNLSEKVNYAGLAEMPTAPSTEVIESRQFLGY
jgi:hypothetical protein